jgi:hypothetical protein
MEIRLCYTCGVDLYPTAYLHGDYGHMCVPCNLKLVKLGIEDFTHLMSKHGSIAFNLGPSGSWIRAWQQYICPQCHYLHD